MTIFVRISFTKYINTKGGSLTDERFKKNLKTFLKFLLNICGINLLNLPMTKHGYTPNTSLSDASHQYPFNSPAANKAKV